MSESHPGTGRGRDLDHLPEPEPEPEPAPGASVFGQTAPYPDQPPHRRTAQYPQPYEDPAGNHGQPPYGQTAPYPGQPPYPGSSAPPGQVHIPAPPPQQPDVAEAPPRHPGQLPRQPDRRQPDPRRPGRRPSDDRPAGEPGLQLPIGAGTMVGVAGLVCFLLALVVLPWFTAEGRGVTLSDMRTAFTIPETQPEDLPGASADEPSAGSGGVPSPDEVRDVVEDEVRDTAAEAAANTIDAGKDRYLELYTETLWIVGAVGVVLAVVLSTILAPRSSVMSFLLGFRRLGGSVTVLVAVAHGAALWIVFTGDGAPDPSFGVWLGLGGLAAILLGCILGPKPKR